MANIKISAAADAGTLLASDMLPLARSGDTTAYHATMAEISAYASTSLASGAYGNIGRNILHNSMFMINQRGLGPFTGTGNYTSDRWYAANTGAGSSNSVQTATLSDANRASIGDEAAQLGLSVQFVGVSAAGSYNVVSQPIEAVWRHSGKTLTVSFWAWAQSGTPRVGVNFTQVFGSGGSANVVGSGQSVTISTTPARYTMTFNIPSVAGKTIGSNNTTEFNLWLSASTDQNTPSGSVGVQSNTIVFWGMQVEVGTVATPLEKPWFQYDYAACERFYCENTIISYGYITAGAAVAMSNSLTVPMRATPTVTFNVTTSTNLTSPSVISAGNAAVQFEATGTATGAYAFAANYAASADL